MSEPTDGRSGWRNSGRISTTAGARGTAFGPRLPEESAGTARQRGTGGRSDLQQCCCMETGEVPHSRSIWIAFRSTAVRSGSISRSTGSIQTIDDVRSALTARATFFVPGYELLCKLGGPYGCGRRPWARSRPSSNTRARPVRGLQPDGHAGIRGRPRRDGAAVGGGRRPGADGPAGAQVGSSPWPSVPTVRRWRCALV
jgi:hypothetical protein